jgi:RNA polymerase-binding protein DksA
MPQATSKLERFRTRLLDMRRRIAGSVEHVVDSINDDANTLANLSSTPVHMADIAQPGIVADVEVLDTENELIEKIDAALGKISAGTYGECESCHAEIPGERLEALPFATMCASCAAKLESAGAPLRARAR